jgi:prepilin-type N-terminal cleavage/methylation domain-containing protein
VNRATASSQAGFSLVEVLIVFIIVSLAVLPLAGVQLSSRRAVDEAQRYGEAVEVAQTQLEKLRVDDFGVVGTNNFVVNRFNVQTDVQPQINPNTGIASSTLETLHVTVNWVEKGDSLSVDLSGLRAARQ